MKTNGNGAANLFLSLASLSLVAGAFRSPLLVAAPQACLGGYGLAVAIRRHQRDGLGFGSYAGAIADLGADVLSLYDSAPEIHLHQLTRLAPPLAALSTADPVAWCTDAFMDSSKMVIGSPGTGKTTWIQYEAASTLARHPSATVRIVDPHWDPDESRWLPGLATSVVEARYLTTTASGAYAAVKEALEELDRRRTGGLKNEPLHKLIIDEFQNIGFTAGQRAEVVEAVGRIVREGRKYQIRLTLGLHSGKKSQTDLDSSFFSAFTLVLMGRTIADQAMRANLPADMEASRLLAEVDAVISAGEDRRRVAIVRPASDVDLGFYAPAAKLLPDPLQEIRLAPPDVEEEASWLAANVGTIAAMVADGKSFSAIAKALGLSLHKADGEYKDPRVSELKGFLNEVNDHEQDC
jgi:hypothetical protein